MPLVTVAEMVRFALPRESAYLAGAEGAAKPVAWARLLRVRPATLTSVEPGEVWLLSAGALQQAGDARGIARLLAAVEEAGVAAFISHEDPGPEARMEADRLGLPLIRVPHDTPLVELEKAIQSFVVSPERMVADRVQEVFDQLLATLVEDHGSELLADLVHRVSGKAVYLLDEHFQATMQAGGDERSSDVVSQARRRFWEGQLIRPGERLLTFRSSNDSDTVGALVRPLVLRGEVEGYLALIGKAADYGDFDYQVAARAASVMAIELAKQKAFVEARLRVQGDFLEDLLDQPTDLTPTVLARARGLGYDLARPHAVVVIRPRVLGEGAPSPRLQQRFADLARRRLVLADVSSLLRERDGVIQALVPLPDVLDPRDPRAVTAWCEALRSDLEAGLEPERFATVSGVGRAPDLTPSYYVGLQEAQRAAEIAAALPEGPGTLHFADLGALRLIFHLSGNPELGAFQRDLLGPLEEYDRQHRSDFIHTLEEFFRAGGNHMQASRELHVHRNTLIYRLERIRELLGGADLENSDVRLNLQLALKIRAAFGAPAASAA